MASWPDLLDTLPHTMNTESSPPSALLSATPSIWHKAAAALRRPSVLLATVALVLLGWQWLETRSRLSGLETELARRLAEGDASLKEGRAQTRAAQEDLQALQTKVGSLEARLAEAQGQQMALEAMTQELSRSRDERLLAEIEQAVSTAAQQLQLAGNVQVALIALQGADARLARTNQPQFIALRKLVTRDIERLRALPTADVPGIALKLETIIAQVDTMPLAFEQRPLAAAPAAKAASPAADMPWWQKMSADFWQEIKQLVRIERIDKADPGLLSPSQNFFLRENLKLRLINARLALLVRDGSSFREDMRQSADWLERHFDSRAKPVQSALTTVRSLGAVDVALTPPTLDETLGALRNFRLAKEKK